MFFQVVLNESNSHKILIKELKKIFSGNSSHRDQQQPSMSVSHKLLRMLKVEKV